MDVGYISGSQLSSIQNTDASQNTAQINGPKAVQERQNDALAVEISDNLLTTKRSELATDFEKINSMLATAQIGSQAVEKQIEILNNFKTTLQDTTLTKDQMQEKLKNYINEFASVDQNATYENNYVFSAAELEKPADIIEDINNTMFSSKSNNTDLQNIYEQINSGIDILKDYKATFEVIKEEAVDLAKEKSSEAKNLSDIYFRANNSNFGRESSDFSKNNITSQMGYFLASQANANQESSIKLLSV